MNGYYTERNYSNNEDYSNNYNTTRINQNSLFRNFLIEENIDSSRKKFFAPKKKEILPSYTNIKEIIEKGRIDIKSKFNIANTLFHEIQSKDIIMYTKFAKNISEYFFGPYGIITENNINLKKYHNQKEKTKKKALNAKIYAGNWLYLEENPIYNRYLARLKNNRKQILNIGGNFSTEDDFTQKLHDIYIKGSKKKNDKSNSKSVKEENTPEKNIFEFTSIDNKKSPLSQKRYINKDKINNLILNITPNSFNKKTKNKYNYSKEEKRNKTMYNVDSYRQRRTIKNIFLKERLKEKEHKRKKKYFSNLKLTINTKIDSLKNPIKDMKAHIFSIKKNNRTFHTFRENKNKYKEDINVIGEDDIKEKDSDYYMEKFIRKAYQIQSQNRKQSIPKKLYFTYHERGNSVRENLKNFVRNIEKVKEEERKIKYGETIRIQFHNNYKLIKKLEKELEELKIKKKLLFED